MKKLTIVIPTYNEADNINRLCEEIENALVNVNYEIQFVDDSKDHTPEIIKELMENNRKIKMYHRTEEKGLATAVLKGFEIASGNYIAVMDADLQHPPEILKDMYIAVDSGADICIPSRYIQGGSDGGLNLYRRFVSGTARYIGKIALPCLHKISDPTSGLFMFQKKIMDNDTKMQPIGWKIMIEVLATCNYKTIIEIPYTFCNRQAGESKLSSKVTLEYLEQVFDLMKRGKKQKNKKVERWSPDKMIAMRERYQ